MQRLHSFYQGRNFLNSSRAGDFMKSKIHLLRSISPSVSRYVCALALRAQGLPSWSNAASSFLLFFVLCFSFSFFLCFLLPSSCVQHNFSHRYAGLFNKRPLGVCMSHEILVYMDPSWHHWWNRKTNTWPSTTSARTPISACGHITNYVQACDMSELCSRTMLSGLLHFL